MIIGTRSSLSPNMFIPFTFLPSPPLSPPSYSLSLPSLFPRYSLSSPPSPPLPLSPLLSPPPLSSPPQLASQLYSQDAEAQQTEAVINQLRQVVATLQTELFKEHVQVRLPHVCSPSNPHTYVRTYSQPSSRYILIHTVRTYHRRGLCMWSY